MECAGQGGFRAALSMFCRPSQIGVMSGNEELRVLNAQPNTLIFMTDVNIKSLDYFILFGYL